MNPPKENSKLNTAHNKICDRFKRFKAVAGKGTTADNGNYGGRAMVNAGRLQEYKKGVKNYAGDREGLEGMRKHMLCDRIECSMRSQVNKPMRDLWSRWGSRGLRAGR